MNVNISNTHTLHCYLVDFQMLFYVTTSWILENLITAPKNKTVVEPRTQKKVICTNLKVHNLLSHVC